MSKMHQLIYAMNSFSTGILLPVLSLVLLEKGATLQTLPLLLAVYSLTVLCLELPSGMFADIYGRKASFIASCGFMAISLILMLATADLPLLIPAIVFFGLGRAFSSGSLDALFIDQALISHGEEHLAKVTTRLSVLEAGSLALGSIAGGFSAYFTGSYSTNIILRLILTAALLIMCLAFVKEQKSKSDCRQKRTSLAYIMKQSRNAISAAPGFGLIFIGVFFAGFFLFTIETYWQPSFISISNLKDSAWVLGILTFIGFVTVISGNSVAEKILKRFNKSWWNIYFFSRLLMAGTIFVFALQKKTAGFIVSYAFIYLLLGISGVTETTLINKFTPGDIRASMLSMTSLISQIGGLCASLFSSIFIIQLQFSGLLTASAALMGCYAVSSYLFSNMRRGSSFSDLKN